MSARASTASGRSRPRPVMLRTLSTQAATITAPATPISQPAFERSDGDRLQVVRDRDRRQGGDDQVVDQDRPAGDEGDQLVEGVAGEAGGAAALAEHRPALDVAERGQHEEQAGDEEDQRRQAEAAVGDDAEREVDREADRGVDGDEEAGHAEAAPQERLQALPLRLLGLAHVRAEIQSRPAPTARKATPEQGPDRERAAAVGERADEERQAEDEEDEREGADGAAGRSARASPSGGDSRPGPALDRSPAGRPVRRRR